VDNAHSYLAFSNDVFNGLTDLLQFNNERICQNPATNTESRKIENIYKQLFERYCRELVDNSKDSFIYTFTQDMEDIYLNNNDDKRIVVDCLAGMTDDFFNNQYQELFVPQSYGYSL
jgi:dGTPase